MSKIRKAIKFYCNGKSKLFISKYLSLSRNTVKKYISLFETLGWYDIIGEKTIADAILDRLIHQSHRLELKGESMRKKRGTNKV